MEKFFFYNALICKPSQLISSLIKSVIFFIFLFIFHFIFRITSSISSSASHLKLYFHRKIPSNLDILFKKMFYLVGGLCLGCISTFHFLNQRSRLQQLLPQASGATVWVCCQASESYCGEGEKMPVGFQFHLLLRSRAVEPALRVVARADASEIFWLLYWSLCLIQLKVVYRACNSDCWKTSVPLIILP